MFPIEDLRDAARSQLERYGRHQWHSEVERVRLAILKWAGADVMAIGTRADDADVDYRDVLVAAEFPSYAALGPAVNPAAGSAQQAIRDDREQYEAWISYG